MAVAVIARVPFGRWLRRLVIELPFLAFAVFLPFVGRGPYVEVGFLTLSEPGLWGAWNIVVKGTLGVAATSLLTATTTVPELLRALDRLRVPRPLVGIASFMVRYGEVLDRRSAADADRPAVPRRRPALALAGGRVWRRRRGRCSSGRTNAASGSTSRCWPAATAWQPRRRTGTPARRRGWVTALTAPIAATAVCVAAVALA